MGTMVNNIKKIRRRKGLSQQALGERIGGDKTTIYKLEKGARRITDEYMFALAKALDVHPMALFDEGSWYTVYVKGHIKMGEEKQSLFYEEQDWVAQTLPTNERFYDASKFIITNHDTGEMLECVSGVKYLNALTVGKRYILEQFVAPDRNRYLLVRIEETPDGEIVAHPDILNGKTAPTLSLNDPCCKIVARIVGSYRPE